MQTPGFHTWVEAGLPRDLQTLLANVREAEVTGPKLDTRHPRSRGRNGN